MKITKKLLAVGITVLMACQESALYAFGSSGGPGQGDYPSENHGFPPSAAWSDNDTTGKTVINSWRTEQEQKVYGSANPVPVLKKEDINDDLLNELEQRIMKDIEAHLAKKKPHSHAPKKSSLRIEITNIETDVKDDASALEAELRNEL